MTVAVQQISIETAPWQDSSVRPISSRLWLAASKGEALMQPTFETFSGERPEPSDEQLVANYVSALWAEDWDSPEDAVYDTW